MSTYLMGLSESGEFLSICLNHQNAHECTISRTLRLVSLYIFCMSRSPETSGINTRVMLEALRNARQDRIQRLHLGSTVLNDGKEVKLLAAVLKSSLESIECLTLFYLVTTTTEDTKVSGFLDSILNAIVQGGDGYPRLLHTVDVRGYMDYYLPIERPSLASIETLQALVYHFVHAASLPEGRRNLHLVGMGLGNEHCKAIANTILSIDDGKALDSSLSPALFLRSNPGVGREGYAALFRALDRKPCMQLTVDDMNWQPLFHFARRAILDTLRSEFLMDGVFASKEKWVDWLSKLTTFVPPLDYSDKDLVNEEHLEEMTEVNYLWITLLQNPDFVSS